MAEDVLTHRDLSRRLGVSVTTIKSYRRKFPEFIPIHSRGKPIRFKQEAEDVCKAIRDHFVLGVSVDEVRESLARDFGVAHPELAARARAADQGATSDVSESASHESRHEYGEGSGDLFGEPSGRPLGGAAMKESAAAGASGDHASFGDHAFAGKMMGLLRELAENQREANERLDKLRELVADFLTLYLSREDVFANGLHALQAMAEKLTRGRESNESTRARDDGAEGGVTLKRVNVRNMHGEVREYVIRTEPAAEHNQDGAANGPPAGEGLADEDKTREKPPDEFIELPLVIKSTRGEYLGVAGKNEGSMSANSVMDLISVSFTGSRRFSFSWSPRPGGWQLNAEQRRAEKPQRYEVDIEETTTPKGNKVALVVDLRVDGRQTPPAYMYTFIKQMRGMSRNTNQNAASERENDTSRRST